MGMIRTGAASGLAARCLARPDARVAGVFGAGWQAEGHVLAICAALPLETRQGIQPQCRKTAGLLPAPERGHRRRRW